MKGETRKYTAKGFPTQADVFFEPAPWFQEHSNKKLKTSADPFGKELVTSADLFGEAYARKELAEEVMFSGQVSNPFLSAYDINVTTVVIQEVVEDTSTSWEVMDLKQPGRTG